MDIFNSFVVGRVLLRENVGLIFLLGILRGKELEADLAVGREEGCFLLVSSGEEVVSRLELAVTSEPKGE